MRIFLMFVGGLLVLVLSFWGTLFILDRSDVARPPVPPQLSLNDGLIGYWAFDDNGPGNTISDRSGQYNDATFTGGALASARVAGKVGQALSFDGANTSVLKSGMSPSTAAEVTVAFWMNARSNGGAFRGLVSAQTSGNDFQEGFNIDLCPTPTQNFNCLSVEGSGITGFWNARSSDTPFNQWVHVIVAIGTGKNGVKVYVNSVLEGQKDRNAATIQLANIRIGTRYFSGTSAGRYFDGVMDEVRIYNRVLSTHEVIQLYSTTK